MYPEQLVKPMKAEMTQVGFEDLTNADAVEKTLNVTSGTVLVFVNSVCGCAAGAARPGVKLSLENAKKPEKLTTVFAGFDTEAVASARNFMLPYPPSSPSIALFKDIFKRFIKALSGLWSRGCFTFYSYYIIINFQD
jgi:putative YphP/YqiW family bacilliredoxin